MARDAVLHQPCPMRKTLSVLVLPAALLFALGLSAYNPDVPVSDPTGPGEGTGAPTSAGGRTTSIAESSIFCPRTSISAEMLWAFCLYIEP